MTAVLLVLSLIAAIFGLQAKNYKATLGIGIVLVVVAVVQIIYAAVSGESITSSLTGLIIPALYTWAVYNAGIKHRLN